MGNPIEDTMRDFAVRELNAEAGAILGIENEHETTIKIFGWELFRVFRDTGKNITKIVLKKGNYFKEFVPSK